MGSATTPLIPPPQHEIRLDEPRRVTIGPQLGRGSMATVYRGVLQGSFGIERAIAVKVFDVIASDETDGIVATLAHAAREAACIRHANVAVMLEFGMLTPVQPFALTELIEGPTLVDVLDAYAGARRRVPLDLALFIGIEIAEALVGARAACTPEGVRLGIVHGELSPNDVILSWSGEVKLTDFGIAAATRAASTVRSVKALTRRIRALAPEVARGSFGDARSDVFALGVILHEMMLGPRFPPTLSDAEAMTYARDGIVHSSVFEPQLAPELRVIMSRALERDPAKRFAHAGALVYELRRVALAMGVGDGRSFLRHALPSVFAADAPAEDVTEEIEDDARPSRVAPAPPDRFALLREGTTESGMMRRASFAANDESEDAVDEERGYGFRYDP